MRNNYKDNNRRSLSGEDHEQAGSFAHFQTDGNSGFINDTELRFIDKTDPLTLLDLKSFGEILLQLDILRALIILTHTISYCYLQFYQFPRYLRKMHIFCLFVCLIIHYVHVIFISHITFD